MSLCDGSPINGIGPPPWDRDITDPFVIFEERVEVNRNVCCRGEEGRRLSTGKSSAALECRYNSGTDAIQSRRRNIIDRHRCLQWFYAKPFVLRLEFLSKVVASFVAEKLKQAY